MLRNEVKRKHEEAVLNNFVKYLETKTRSVKINDQPDPPDALVSIDGKSTWIEITDAFLNRQLAESITSYVSDDKKHKPVPKEHRSVVEPDQTFDGIIDAEIRKKYQKMRKIYAVNGSGILLVGVQSPFTTAKTISSTKQVDASKFAGKNDCKIFSEMYFYDTSGSAFYRAKLFNFG